MKKLFLLCLFLCFGIICFAQDMVPIPGTNIEMMKTEVTQQLYEEIMGNNPSVPLDGINGALNNDNIFNKLKKISKSKGKVPINNVNWYDAIEFCNALSRKNGMTEVYIIQGYDGVVDEQIKMYESKMREEGVPDQIIQRRVEAEKSEMKQNLQAQKQRYGFNVSVNDKANGFRLPTINEWKKAWKYMFDSKELVDLVPLDLEWCWDNYEEQPNGECRYVGNWQEGPMCLDATVRAWKFSFRVVRNIK